jgi:hypothetical protein
VNRGGNPNTSARPELFGFTVLLELSQQLSSLLFFLGTGAAFIAATFFVSAFFAVAGASVFCDFQGRWETWEQREHRLNCLKVRDKWRFVRALISNTA